MLQPLLKLSITILWPSFMVAIVAEGFFFSMFDPYDLMHIVGQPELRPIAVYSLGFFSFWLLCSLASMLTYYLITVPHDDKPPF